MIRILCIISVLLICFSINLQPVGACISAFDFWSLDYMLEWSEYFVKGKIVEADDVQQNFILEVEHSLKSIPPSEVLIYNTNPAIPSAHSGHYYLNACTYNGGVYIDVGDTGYFPLQRLPNGAYQTLLHLERGTIFSDFDMDSEAIIRTGSPFEEDGSSVGLSDGRLKLVSAPNEETFINLVKERGGSNPIAPKPVAVAPILYAPIFFQTDTGESYIVPIDGGELVPAPENVLFKQTEEILENVKFYCSHDDCLNFSPDMALFTVPKPDHVLILDYAGRWAFDFPPSELPGEYIVFAPTNDAAAIWNNNLLDIYEIKWDHRPAPRKYASISLQIREEMTSALLHKNILWNDNGNILALADDRGVWWFDLFQSDQPQLVAPNDGENSPQLIQLSRDGRYLAYSLNDDRIQWKLHDVVTGQDYDNVLIAPNGRNSISINLDTNATPSNLPFASENNRNHIIFPGERWDMQWIEDDGYLIKFCPDETVSCRAQYCYPGNFAVINEDVSRCIDVADFFRYRMVGDVSYFSYLGVVAAGERNIIVFNKFYPAIWNYIELPKMDGNITHVEWMLPLFYFRD